MLRKAGISALSISTLFVTRAWATDWTYDSQGSIATELTGGYGAVADPSTGYVYNDGFGDYSYPVILDSGSSGFLMSETVTDEFSVPLQNGTYTETGIGGSEVENITQPLVAYYAPASDGNPDDTSTMTAYGTYTFESRQNDPYEGLIYFDVIGTPIIQNQVMVVSPNQSYDLVQDTLGFLTAQTVLQPTAPVLPTKGLYHVPITWTNFVSGTPVPSEGLNPVVNGVTARGPSGVDVANNWLFDSGAQFTIISPTYATQLGINLNDPITTITGQGVGGATVTFDGFQITDIALPLSDGDRLVFDNPTVYVPVDTSLPAGLTGILGENLFMQATDEIDPYTGLPTDTYAPLFSEWYLDGPGSQLVLYDPNSAYAPHASWISSVNGNWSDPSKWSSGAVPTSANDVNFNIGTGPAYSVALTGASSANNLTVAGDQVTIQLNGNSLNIAAALTVSGSAANPSSLTLSGGGAGMASIVSAANGIFVQSSDSPSNATLTLNGATVRGNVTNNGVVNAVGWAANFINGRINGTGTLAVGNGANPAFLSLSAGSFTDTQTALTVFTGSVLDITNNNIILTPTAGNQAADLARYLALVKQGYNNGSWTGQGITSSLLPTVNAFSPLYGIAVAENDGAFGTVTGLANGQIEITEAVIGDATLSGTVNFADFVKVEGNYGLTGADWDEGDFFYTGTVNFADFVAVEANFGDTNALSAPEMAAMQSFAANLGDTLVANPDGVGFQVVSVPEPASAGLLALAGVGLLARRRRRAGCNS